MSADIRALLLERFDLLMLGFEFLWFKLAGHTVVMDVGNGVCWRIR